VIFPTGFGRLTGDFSRFAGSRVRVRVYARVKRVPARRLRGGAGIVPGVFGLQACLLAFPGGFPVVSGRLPGCLACMLPLCLIAGVFAVRTGLKTRKVWLFFWNKTPYFGALFLGLRSYSFPK